MSNSAVALRATSWRATSRHRLSRAAFVGAAALLVAAAFPGGSSQAAAAPDFDYVALATAVGIQAQLDSNPEPTPVPDLTDLESPTSNARLDSFGTSSAQADIGNLNGIAKLPGLICLAAGGCDSFPAPAGITFPPTNPLEADASDPGTPEAVAPSVAGGSATVKGGQAGLATYSAGVAHAHAVPLATHTDATAGGYDLLSAIHVGAVTTTSDESAAGAGVTTAATSTVSDVDIGSGLIHIGSVVVATSVTAVPGTPPDRSDDRHRRWSDRLRAGRHYRRNRLPRRVGRARCRRAADAAGQHAQSRRPDRHSRRGHSERRR